MARIIGQQAVRTRLGQPVLVEHRPGAGGTLGARRGRKSATGWLHGTAHRQCPGDQRRALPHPAIRPVEGFRARDERGQQPVRAGGFPENASDDHRGGDRPAPAPSQAASTMVRAGMGAPLHLLAEMFKHAAGLDIAHIPYRGDAPMLTALLSGDVQIAFMPQGTGVPQVQNGQVQRSRHHRPISDRRRCPKLPTLLEAGVEGPGRRHLVRLVCASRHASRHRCAPAKRRRRGAEIAGRRRASSVQRQRAGRQPAARVRRALQGRHRQICSNHRRRENSKTGLKASHPSRRGFQPLLGMRRRHRPRPV